MNSILMALMLVGPGGNVVVMPPLADTVVVQPGPTITSMRVGLDMANPTSPNRSRESMAGIVPTARKTRWVEGGVIGAIVGGVGFQLLRTAGENHSEIRDNTMPRYFVPFIGAAAGFVIGALIGHGFER